MTVRSSQIWRAAAAGALVTLVSALARSHAQTAWQPTQDPVQSSAPNQAVAAKVPGLRVPMKGLKPALSTHLVLSCPSGEVSRLAFSPNGQTLASGGASGSVILWSVSAGKQLQYLAGHTGLVTALAFSPDGRTLASSAWNPDEAKGLILWDSSGARKPRGIKAHAGRVRAVVFSPDGKSVVSASWVDENAAIVWDADTTEKIRTIRGASYQIHSLAFTRDGQYLVMGGGEAAGSPIIVWDVAGGKAARVLTGGPSGAVTDLAVGASDRTLVSLAGGRLAVWNLEAGKLLRTVAGVPAVRAMALAPDGRTIAFATAASDEKGLMEESKGGVLHFRDVPEDAKLLSLEGMWFSALAFAPDGRFLAAARQNTNTIVVMDTRGLTAFASLRAIVNDFRKDEFETTAEYEARVGGRTVPYEVPIALAAYDADKGAFAAEIAGVKMAVMYPRDQARVLSERRGDLRFGGTVRYYDKDNLVLVDTYLVDGITKIPVTVENVQEPEVKKHDRP